MALRGFVKDYELALEIGMDTGRGTSRDTERMDGIKTISSGVLEALNTALNQYAENPKSKD